MNHPGGVCGEVSVMDLYEPLYRESVEKRLEYIGLLERIKVILEFPMDDSRRVAEIRECVQEFEDKKRPGQ